MHTNLEYRKTQDYRIADCLGRLPISGDRPDIEPPGDVLMLEAVDYPPVSEEGVASATLRDPLLQGEEMGQGWLARTRCAPQSMPPIR
ncbi:hypothetical protein MRX96_054298 [Rhipicephalus microplus]